MASDRIDLLRRVPLFSDLERREIEELAGSLKERDPPQQVDPVRRHAADSNSA